MSDPDRNRRLALDFLDAFATYDPARFLPLMTARRSRRHRLGVLDLVYAQARFDTSSV